MAHVRNHIIALLLALLFVSGGSARAGDDKVYSIGVVPQFEAMKMASIWLPILKEIERLSGYQLRMHGAPDIPSFEQSFRYGYYDFAYMNPYHYVVAYDTRSYAPIIRDGARQLSGVLVVRKDSPFQTPSDLAGQRIAFPAPNALGASLLIRSDLAIKYGISHKAIFVSTHSSAYLNVAMGAALAAGGIMGTLQNQPPEVRDSLRILLTTTKVNPHPIVVHPRVPQAVSQAVQQAFLDLSKTPEGRRLLAGIPMEQPIIAKDSDYDAVRALHLERFAQ